MNERMYSRGSHLKSGALAPGFELPSNTGHTVSREQFRGKSGLLILFFREAVQMADLLVAIARDAAEYRELNAQVLGISSESGASLETFRAAHGLPFTFLSDPHGKAWHLYTGMPDEDYAYAGFVLDTYGGVDTQIVADKASDLPDAPQWLEYVRGAQYRCSV